MSDGTESAEGRYGQAKVRVQEVLTGVASDTFGRVAMFSLIGLILLNVLAVMAESVAWIKADYGNWLAGFEIFSVTVFVIEYMLRLWSCTANRRFRGTILGRMRFALTPRHWRLWTCSRSCRLCCCR